MQNNDVMPQEINEDNYPEDNAAKRGRGMGRAKNNNQNNKEKGKGRGKAQNFDQQYQQQPFQNGQMVQTRQLLMNKQKQNFFKVRETCLELKAAFESVIADVKFSDAGATFYLISGAEAPNADDLADFEKALDSL